MHKCALIVAMLDVAVFRWTAALSLGHDHVVFRPPITEGRMPPNALKDPDFEKAGTPQSDWQPFDKGFVIDRHVRCEGAQSIRCHADDSKTALGATAAFTLNQRRIVPVRIAVKSKCADVPGTPSGSYCIWLDILHTDGTPTWGVTRPFSTGTHDWERQTLTLVPVKPIARLYVHCLFRWVPGTAWFDDASVWILNDIKADVFEGELVELVEPTLHSTDTAPDRLRGTEGSSAMKPFAQSNERLEIVGDAASGRILGIRAEGLDLPAGRLAGGIFVQDAAQRGEVCRLAGPVRMDGTVAKQTGTISALSLDVVATWTSKKDRISGRIELTSRKPVERLLSIVAAIPIRAAGWTWHDDIRRSRQIKLRQAAEPDRPRSGLVYDNTARLAVGKTGNSSKYPLAAIGNDREGIAIAVPLDEPRVFRLVYDSEHEWLYAAFDLTISPEPVKLRNRAYVDFELFSFDPKWGFRAALQRYYDLHPEHFTRRVNDTGLWMAFAKISKVQQPEDFGFYFKEGLGDEAYDNAHSILTFRYTEPQSHWLPMPKGMKRSYDEAINLLKRRSQEGDAASRRPHLAALTSGAMDANGHYHVGLYDTPWCDGAVFALNPSPGLPGDVTKARIDYDPAEAQRLYADDPQHGIDGEYLDSLDGWSRELNYRREHFKWVDVPLVYDTETRRPCIINAFSIWEFVRWMSVLVHARGKLMMANYTPTEYPWQVPHLDVMGQETNWNPGGQWSPMSDADLCYRLSLCRTKPYLFLQNSDFKTWTDRHTRWYMMRAGAYGMQPSFFSMNAATNHYFENPTWYNRDRPIFKQLMPIIRRIGRAGWRPVTYARVEPPPLQVERFGGPGTGELLLTVHNPDEKPASGRLTLESEVKAGRAIEMVASKELVLTRVGERLTIDVTVPGRETLFVHLTEK
jgi:hypothetical protein